MRINSLNSGGFNEKALLASVESRSQGAAEWTAIVNKASTAEAPQNSLETASSKSEQAALKLSEMLVAHALHEVLPRESSDNSGLAFDTWRGMLADAIAQEVAPHVNLLPTINLGLPR